MRLAIRKLFTQKYTKLIAGAVLVVSGFSFIYLGAKEQLGIFLSTSFGEEPVIVEGFANATNLFNPPNEIVIPELKIGLPVELARKIDGYWEVFSDKAGWGEGTAYPGQKGNQVIFAHARRGLFLPLRKAKVGMEIVVRTANGEYRYQIKEIKEVKPDEVEVVKETEEETLTLYTCSGFADSKRLIVIATPVS